MNSRQTYMRFLFTCGVSIAVWGNAIGKSQAQLIQSKSHTKAIKQSQRSMRRTALSRQPVPPVKTKRGPLFSTPKQLRQIIEQQEQYHVQDRIFAEWANPFKTSLMFSLDTLLKFMSPVSNPEAENADYLRSRAYYLELHRRSAVGNRTVPNALIRARQHRDSMTVASGTSWSNIGPENLPPPYTGYFGSGPLSGRVSGVAYASSSLSLSGPLAGSGTYYVAAAGGGVWSAQEGSNVWKSLSDDWPALQTSCIAVQARQFGQINSDNDVVYVGTGDFDQEMGVSGWGIMRSQDGGKHWKNVGIEMGSVAVSKVIIDPDNPKVVNAVTGRGTEWKGAIWHTTDGGEHWQTTLVPEAGRETAWTDLCFSLPNAQGKRYYYAVGCYNELWRSADQGATWTDLGQTLKDAGLRTDSAIPLKVTCSQAEASVVYILSGADHKILRSKDAGSHWPMDITGDLPDNWDQAFYDSHLTCASYQDGGQKKDLLYAGLISLYVSKDGGRGWKDVGVTRTHNALTHNDQHCMAVMRSGNMSNEGLVGNDGGVYHYFYDASTNSVAFQSLNASLCITQFYSVACSPDVPSEMMGGTQDNGTPLALGIPPIWYNLGPGDGGGCAIHSVQGNLQCASSEQAGAIYITHDNWQHTDTQSPRDQDIAAWVAPVAFDKQDPNVLYVGTNYLARYNIQSQVWEKHLGNQLLAGSEQDDPGYLLSVVVTPTDSNRIYVGSNRGELWMSTNRGVTWSPLSGGAQPFPSLPISSISVHPLHPEQIMISLAGLGGAHLWRCDNTDLDDTSRHWIDISGPKDAQGAPLLSALPDCSLNTVVRAPHDLDKTFFVGTDVGVFVTHDGGNIWLNATHPLGLPNVEVSQLQIVRNAQFYRLTAATFGRGLWQVDLTASP